MNLGVTVLASFGGGHFNDLAWSALDDDETVLSESRTLHRVGQRGASIGRLEVEVFLYTSLCQSYFLPYSKGPSCDQTARAAVSIWLNQTTCDERERAMGLTGLTSSLVAAMVNVYL